MSLVIGMKIKEGLLFVSDGLALIENKRAQTVNIRKLYTFSKIRVIRPWDIIFSYVGSTKLFLKIIEPLSFSKISHRQLDLQVTRSVFHEAKFIRHICTQVVEMQKGNADENGILVLLGYNNGEQPKMVLINSNGKAVEVSKYLAIGSAAGMISKELKKRYKSSWDLETAVENAVDLIYLGSEVPTVNFLPMIAVLSREGVRDYSNHTIIAYRKFKRDLKKHLVGKVLKIL